MTADDSLMTLEEIRQISGHERPRAAAVVLKRKGKFPVSYMARPGKKGSPLAQYRTADVYEVFGQPSPKNA